MKQVLKSLGAGMTGGFVGNGILGALFTSRWVHDVLYDPARQSPLFIEITPTRDIPVSVTGLVILSAIHGWLYYRLESALPGRDWVRKGLFWGLTLWLMYWLFQEWFIYHTLLREPLLLNAFELMILLLGSLAEGLTIAFLMGRNRKAVRTAD